MAKLFDLARMLSTTTGTGATIALDGGAKSGYLTFAQAGAQDGDVLDYAINDGAESEVGTATYSSTGPQLTGRTVTSSTNSNSAINLSGAAEVFISPRAETLLEVKQPQGRLTLQSGVPVMTSDQIGKQTLYYAPFCGKKVPVYTNGTWSEWDFTSGPTDQVGLSLALAGSANWAAGTIHDVFAIVDGGVLKLATRLWDSGMYPTETQITNATTITTGTGSTAWLRSTAAFDGVLVQGNAASARVFPSNSGLANNLGQDWGVGVTKSVSKYVITAASDTFLRNDVGGVPALQLLFEGSNDGTNWYRIGFSYVNSSTLGASYTIPVNVSNRTAYRYHRVSITGDGSNSVNVAEIQFYQTNDPANGRRLTMIDGMLVNDAAMTARIDASTTVSVAQYEGIYLGTIGIDAASNGQVTAHVSYGPDRVYNVWNAYNKRRISLRAGVFTPGASSYVLTSQLWQIAQTGFSLKVLQGLAEEFIPALLVRGFYINASAGRKIYEAGIAVDNTTTFSGVEIAAVTDNTGPLLGYANTAYLDLPPFAGIKTLNAIERTDAGAGSVSPSVEQRSTELRAEWMS